MGLPCQQISYQHPPQQHVRAWGKPRMLTQHAPEAPLPLLPTRSRIRLAQAQEARQSAACHAPPSYPPRSILPALASGPTVVRGSLRPTAAHAGNLIRASIASRCPDVALRHASVRNMKWLSGTQHSWTHPVHPAVFSARVLPARRSPPPSEVCRAP